MTPPSALLVVPDGAALSWQRVVAGYGHAAPLGRLYIFFEVRSASDAQRREHAVVTTRRQRATRVGGVCAPWARIRAWPHARTRVRSDTPRACAARVRSRWRWRQRTARDQGRE
jgi:hypothetical protein